MFSTFSFDNEFSVAIIGFPLSYSELEDFEVPSMIHNNIKNGSEDHGVDEVPFDFNLLNVHIVRFVKSKLEYRRLPSVLPHELDSKYPFESRIITFSSTTLEKLENEVFS